MKSEKRSGETVPMRGGPAVVPVKTGEVAKGSIFGPTFVEAERMFDKMAEMTRQVAQKAFDYFNERGGEIGRELDDWFKAENELLRPIAVEVREDGNNIIVRAAVAGFKPEEVEISIKDNVLMMSGKTEQKNRKESEKTYYSEWKSDRFFRQLTLPQNVDPDKARTTLKDGVLEFVAPKIAKREATKIPIEH